MILRNFQWLRIRPAGHGGMIQFELVQLDQAGQRIFTVKQDVLITDHMVNNAPQDVFMALINMVLDPMQQQLESHVMHQMEIESHE